MILVLTLIFAGLAISTGVTFYSGLNCVKKYTQLESDYDELDGINTDNVNFILNLRSRVVEYNTKIRQLDRLGAFESDDEVGYFFTELKTIVEDISTRFDIPLEVSDNDEYRTNRPNSSIETKLAKIESY